jgi:hypothetical protein
VQLVQRLAIKMNKSVFRKIFSYIFWQDLFLKLNGFLADDFHLHWSTNKGKY